MADGTPSVFVFLNRKILRMDGVRTEGTLPPQIKEKNRIKNYIVILLLSGTLVAPLNSSRTPTVFCPPACCCPCIRGFTVRYVIRIIVLVTASDTRCRPFGLLQPSVPRKPFLT